MRAEHYEMTVEFDHVCYFEPSMTHCWELEEASNSQEGKGEGAAA